MHNSDDDICGGGHVDDDDHDDDDDSIIGEAVPRARVAPVGSSAHLLVAGASSTTTM